MGPLAETFQVRKKRNARRRLDLNGACCVVAGAVSIHQRSIDGAGLSALIRRARLPLGDEKATQTAMAELFTAHNIAFEREKALSKTERLDFFIPPGLAIEVKLNGARSAEIYRQLARYALHDCVRGIMLVTNRAVAVPVTIHGKPTYYVSLGQAWL
jgi:hypothetical protein